MKYFTTTLLFLLLINNSTAQLHQEFIERLEEGLIEIEEVFNPIGLTIAVKRGDDIWSNQIGMSSASEPLTEGSQMAMGSITKTFVSACILSMMEEGLLTLSDPIGMYVETNSKIDSSISIRQLLNHTSGIFNYTDNDDFFEEIFSDENQNYSYSPQEVLDIFVLDKIFEKGKNQQYSNTNYLLLGMIITEIAGRPYHEEIFDRFDVQSKFPSINNPPFTLSPTELANLWFDMGQGLQDVKELDLGLDGLFSAAGSAGAFTSDAIDLVKWGYELYSGELLEAASMDSMFTIPDFELFPDFSYGLGVGIYSSSCNLPSVGHSGGIIYTSDLAYIEQYDLAIAVMTNDGDGIPNAGGVIGINQGIACLFELTLTSINDEDVFAEKLRVYPNPTTGFINLEINNLTGERIELNIYNELGINVGRQTLIGREQKTSSIDLLVNQPSGVYHLQFSTKDKVITKKIVKL